MLKLKKSVKIAASLTAFMILSAGCDSSAQPNRSTGPSVSAPSPTHTASTTQQITATATPPGGLSLSGLKAVSAGYTYSLAVAEDGGVLAWGNYAGAIQGEQYPIETEKIQAIDTGAKSVSAAYDFCAEIKTDGSLWVWGRNKAVCGEAGATAPVKVLDGVASVSLGGSFVLAVKTDGTLWAWGDNHFGQLGDSAKAESIAQPTQVMRGIKKAEAGGSFSLILLNDGTLMGAGLNGCGQLLKFSNKQENIYRDTDKKADVQTVPVKLMDHIADIAAGSSHSLALDDTGVLWGFGENREGEIGNNWDAKNTVLEPIYADAQCRVPVKIMGGVQSIFASGNGSGAIKADGTLWLWGENNGKIGDGKFLNVLVPKKILDSVAYASLSGTHTMAVKADGTLWAWGHNAAGELGQGYCNYQYAYVQVADGVKQVVSNDRTTLIVKTDGSLWGAGSNDYGQLASDTLHASPGFVQLMTDVKQADLGKNAAFCIKADGTLWSWGNNLYGALGNGILEEGKYAYSDDNSAYSNHKLPKNYRQRMTAPLKLHAPAKVLEGVREVYADMWTVYAVKADNTLWGWGMNEYGSAFADKTFGNTATPAARMKGVEGILAKFMVKKTDGLLYTWGYASVDGSDFNKLTKTQISGAVSAEAFYSNGLASKSDGTLWAWGTFGSKKFDKPVQIEDHIRKMTVDSDIFLLKDDRTLYRLGQYDLDNFMSTVGGSTQAHVIKSAERVMAGVADAVMDKNGILGGENGCSFIIKTDGTLWANGYNNYGELGDGKAIFEPKQISN